MITTFRGENISRQVQDPLSNTVTTRDKSLDDNDTFVNDDISDDDEDSNNDRSRTEDNNSFDDDDDDNNNNDNIEGGDVNASVLIDDEDVVFERNDNNVRIMVTFIYFM